MRQSSLTSIRQVGPQSCKGRFFRLPPVVKGAECVLETRRRLIRVAPYCQNTRIVSVFRIGRKAAVSVSAGGCDPQSTHNRPITDPYPAVSTPSRIAYPRIRKCGAVSAVSHFYGMQPTGSPCSCLTDPVWERARWGFW